MQSTNEVISLVNAADSAVRTVCVMELLKDARPVPPFARDAIEGAIVMLDDALAGSALLTGNGDFQGFSGNLDALCWATDSYIVEQTPGRSAPEPSAVQEFLKSIRGEMINVRAKIQNPTVYGATNNSFERARSFFEILAKQLSQRATTSLTRSSRVLSAV